MKHWIRLLCLSLLSIVVGAASAQNVAKIGSTEYATLQEAVDAAHDMSGDVTITLIANTSGYAIVHQKAGLNLTIDGDNKTLNGQIIIDGDGNLDGTDALTIQNIKFEMPSAFCTGTDAFVVVPSTKTTGTPYYAPSHNNHAHNITISDCTFTGNYPTSNIVGFKSHSGIDGMKNLVMENVTATNLHSLAQLTATKGATFDNCTATQTGSFIAVNGGDGTYTVSNCTFESHPDKTDGYAYREKSNSTAVATLTNNNFKAHDAIILGSAGAINVESGTYDGVISKTAGTIAVTGGTFSQPVDENLIAEGYGCFGNADGTFTVKEGTAVATIGGNKQYETLETAFAAAQDGETITLLANCAGNGIKAPEGKFTNGLTVDFGGFTYTVDGATVGSSGTETQAFQLLKDNKITFQNGTIYSEKALMLVQNYSDLTLENMTLTLNNGNYSNGYTLSNNNGNVVINNTIINANPVGKFAFDVCRYSSYPSVNVTVTGNSNINGDIEVDAGSGDAKDGFSLMLAGGTHTGNIVLTNNAKTAMEATPDKAVIQKSDSYVQDAPEGYKWVSDGNGTSTLAPKTYVAQIGTTKYETIAAAVAAATDGQTVEVIMAGEYTLPGLPKNITVEGAVDGVVFNHTTGDNIASIPNGATFKNVAFNFGNVNYHGFQHAGTINMEGCTLNGKLFSYADMNFTDCSFNQSNSDYHMWTYSGNVTYTGCTFTNSVTGKFLNVYNESGATKYTVTVNNCKFVNNASSANKAALNVKATSGSNLLAYDVIINNCTTEGAFPEASSSDALVVLNSLAQVDDRTASGVDNITVIQDGVLIYPATVAKIGDVAYPTLQSAVDAAQQIGGAVTVNIIDDISGETVTIKEVANFQLTIDGQKDASSNYTVDAVIVVDGLRGNGGSTTNGASVTLQNIAFVKTTATDGIQASHYPHHLTIQDCTYSGSDNDKWFFNASVDGPLYGVTIKDVTVEHARLIYANMADDAVFQNITATNDIKVGFNVKTSGTALIENCQITTGKYAFRDYSDGYEGTFTLKDNIFISTSEESDEGVIVNRGGAVGTAHVNVESGTYTGHLKVLNSKEGVLAISGGYFSEEFPQEYIAADLVAQGKVCAPATDKEGYFTIGDPHYVAQIGETKYVSLQAALDAAHEMTGDVTITLLDDISNYSIVHQKAGLNLTIDGADKKVTSNIIVDGDGRGTGTETLTIQNIKFEGDGTDFCSGTSSFVEVPSTKTEGTPYYTSKYNYAHNITVTNCSFTSTTSGLTMAAIRSNSGAGAYNVVISDCTGTNLHSLAQLTGTTGGSITGNTVSGSESFVNVSGGAGEFVVSGNTFTSAEGADGYGIRENGTSAAVLNLTDNTFTATNAVVLGKGSSVTAGTINVISGTYVGDITKTDAATGKIVITDGHFSAPLANPAYAEFIGEGLCGVNGLYPEDTAAPNGIGTAVATVTNGTTVITYASLEAAFAAAVDGSTITLLKSTSGNGIKALEGKFTNGLTVDFGGFTYTVDGATVGSSGTETQAFQLLKNNKITFKNGTIYSEKAKMLVQNYSDLTLEGMTLTLNNENYASAYTLSNNNGNVVIDGTTINANPAGAFAFDVCRYSSYSSVSVTVKGESVINGDVEVSASGSDAKDGFNLMFEAGTLNGEIVLDATAKAAMEAAPDKTDVSKSNALTAIAAPTDYKWVDNGDGTSSLAPCVYVAQIGEGESAVKYESLADAIAAVPTDGTVTTITMIADDAVVAGVTIAANQNVVLELNGKTISGNTDSSKTYALITNKGTLVIQDNTDANLDGTGTGLITTYISNPDGGDVPGYASNTITNNGNLTVKSGKIVNNGAGYACFAIDNQTNGNLYNPTLIIDGGRMQQMNEYTYAVRMFANSTTKVNKCEVNGGVIEGGYGLWLQTPNANANKADLKITGGIMNANDGAALYIGGTKADNSNISIDIAGGQVNGTGIIIQGPLSGTYGHVSIADGEFVNVQCGANVEKFISGGIFKNAVQEAYCAEGYIPTANTDPETKDAYPYTVKTGAYVAQIGEGDAAVKYETLEDAFSAATSGQTVTLLTNVALTDRLFVNAGASPAYAANNRYATTTEDKSVTLDLNGNNVTSSSNIALAGGSLNIINNGTADATHGVISTSTNGLAPVEIRGTGDPSSKRTLTVGEKVTLKGAVYGLNVFGTNDAQKNNIEVTVNGKVVGELFVLGNLKNEENNIVITVNGSVDASDMQSGEEEVKTAIAQNGNAKVIVNDGAFVKGETGIEVRAGELTVNGGTITATASEYSYTANGSGTTIKGAAIAVAPYDADKELKVTVSDGTLSGAKLIAVVDVQENLENVTVTAKDGFVDGADETLIPQDYKWVSDGEGMSTLTPKTYVAQIGETKFETLTAAVAAAQSGETIELLADITTETGNKSLKAGVTLDGKGKTISGDIAIYISKDGGTVQNVNFKNIHNASKTKSAIYSESLASTATISGCTFDNCDWDAIQITPVAGANVVITNNTFSDDSEDGVTQKRYIHIQSKENVDFSATITENVMLGNNGGPLDVYYPTDKSKLNLTNNYIEVVDDNLCILLADDDGFAGELAFPAYTTADKEETYSPEAYVQNNQYSAKFYMTFAEAATAAGNDKVVSLVTNVADTYTMSEGQTLKVKKNGKTATIKAPEGMVLVSSSPVDGVITYTLAEADIEYTAANGTVSLKTWSSTVISGSGTYKLLKDITASARIVPGMMTTNVTLDLNGHTLTSTATDCGILLSRTGSATSPKTFSLVDTSEEGGGKLVCTNLDASSNSSAAIQVTGKYNFVTIGENVSIEGGCVAMLSENQTLTVNGTINGGNDFAVATNGSSTKNATININDGAVLTSNVTAMYLPGTGTTTISGGTITGSNGIYVKSGELNITGGEITGNGEAVEFVHNPNGTSSVGAALVVENCSYPGGAPTVNVTGGTFTSVNADAIASYSFGDGNEPIGQFVHGGFFSTELDRDICEEGKKTVPSTVKEGYYELADIVYVAKIGETQYETLEEAWKAVNDGETITLLKDCEGNGLIAPQGKFTNGVTVDFNTFTYSVTGTLVGSPGTETQGFQLLKDNNITFKNGTIYSEKALFLVQNYSNLTLEGMTLTLNNANYAYGYTLSNNNGNVVIDGTTINANPAGAFAFDVCRNASYPSVSVTVKGESVINGDVEVSASGSDAKNGFSLMFEGGTLNGEIVLDETAKTAMANTPDKAKVGKFNELTDIAAPADYKWVDNGDGKSYLAPCEYIAAIGSTKYETLQEAVNAAGTAETTITLLTEAATNGVISGDGVVVPSGSNITFDLNGLTYDVAGETVGSNNTETNGFQFLQGSDITFKNGTLKATSPTAQMLIQNYSNLTLEDVNLDGTTLSGWAYALSNNCGTINLTGSTSITAKTGGRAFDTCKFGSYAIPTVNINTTGAITGPVEATGGKLNIENGKFNVTWVTNNNYSDGDIQIKGGIFSEKPAEEYLVEGYVTTENKDDETKAAYPYAVMTKEDAGIYDLYDLLASNTSHVPQKTIYTLEEDTPVKVVTYYREFSTTTANTRQCWMVPFDYTLTAEDLEKCTFYRVHMFSAPANQEGVVEDENEVVMKISELTAGYTLKANKPYIIKPKAAGVYEFVAENTTLKAKNTESLLTLSTSINDYDFYGVYDSYGPMAANQWFSLNTNGMLKWNAENQKLGPYRWYIKPTFTGDDYANIAFVIDEEVEGDETTTIDRLIYDPNAEIEGFYTVGGVKLDKPVRGLNIVKYTDGRTKKVYVK